MLCAIFHLGGCEVPPPGVDRVKESLFLSSILLNSEAWVNYTEQDVRILEQCDEILLTRILDCDANTSNALKYFELGILPIRHEIMKRKLSFLQYLL